MFINNYFDKTSITEQTNFYTSILIPSKKTRFICTSVTIDMVLKLNKTLRKVDQIRFEDNNVKLYESNKIKLTSLQIKNIIAEHKKIFYNFLDYLKKICYCNI